MKNHILLVEGNRQFRESLKPGLEKYYYVNEVTECRAAITIASETIPDLIISDIAIGDMNGFDFCKFMKSKAETTHIPFIIMSAHDAPDLKMQGLKSGADHYFSRPLSTELLLVTIRNIFERDLRLKQMYTDHYLSGSAESLYHNRNKTFSQQLQDVLSQNIENPTLDVDFLCRHLYVSRSKLYQKVKLISDQPVGEIIRKFRLKKAVQLMKDEDIAMNDLVYRIGFQSSSNFSRAFKKEYGKPPLQFLNGLRKASCTVPVT